MGAVKEYHLARWSDASQSYQRLEDSLRDAGTRGGMTVAEARQTFLMMEDLARYAARHCISGHDRDLCAAKPHDCIRDRDTVHDH